MHKINTTKNTIYVQVFIKVKFPKILGTKVELCLLEAIGALDATGLLEAWGALDAAGLLEACGVLEATGALEACRELELFRVELLFSEFVELLEFLFESAVCWFEGLGLSTEEFVSFVQFWLLSFDSIHLFS